MVKYIIQNLVANGFVSVRPSVWTVCFFFFDCKGYSLLIAVSVWSVIPFLCF